MCKAPHKRRTSGIKYPVKRLFQMGASFWLFVSIQNPPATVAEAMRGLTSSLWLCGEWAECGNPFALLFICMGLAGWASRPNFQVHSRSLQVSACLWCLPLQAVHRGVLLMPICLYLFFCPLHRLSGLPYTPRIHFYISCLYHILHHYLEVCPFCCALPSTIVYCHYLLVIGILRPQP